MLARRLIAAHDRHWLRRELAPVYALPDADDAVEPVSSVDKRVPIVARALDQCRWRSLTLAAICRHALAGLDSWDQEQRWLEIELAWILDDSDT